MINNRVATLTIRNLAPGSKVAVIAGTDSSPEILSEGFEKNGRYEFKYLKSPIYDMSQ